MSRTNEVMHRYDALRSVMSRGVSVFVVGDPAGAKLNAAVRRIRYHVLDGGSTAWDELLRMANVLRWRRITQPQPNFYSPYVAEITQNIARQAMALRNFVDAKPLLDDLESAALAVAATDSPVGSELLRSVEEVGPEHCVVVASNGSARAGLFAWLGEHGATVVTPSQLGTLQGGVDLSYIAGPPTFFPRGLFPHGLVTAPATAELTFVMPAWFDQRFLLNAEYVLPQSAFGEYAEGGLNVRAGVYHIGNIAAPEPELTEDPRMEDIYYPEPLWGSRTSGDRDPLPDETEAWKILLGGGLALWLDDGERIRSLDLTQPEGARVDYESVDDVSRGTYLVLRDGETERQAMYDAALAEMKNQSARIEATQEKWKGALADRLTIQNLSSAIDELRQLGVRSASRVRAWTEPTLICPKRAEDLAILLQWLGMPEEPAYSHAIALRRALYRASADLSRELERAIGRADIGDLERNGIMHLDLQREGFRGMIVVRVLARSPFTEIVSRQRTRIPFEDEGAKWLE